MTPEIKELMDKFVITRQGKDMIMYKGLLAIAHQRGLQSIQTAILQYPSDENNNTTICTATVVMKDGTTFTEIGDANKASVGPTIVLHAIRMASTRAKGRALRDALDIGIVSIEELADDEEKPVRAKVEPAALTTFIKPVPPPLTEEYLKSLKSVPFFVLLNQVCVERGREKFTEDEARQMGKAGAIDYLLDREVNYPSAAILKEYD